MSRDVGMAADLLRPVWEASGTEDGWVSIEVAPSLALDTEATVAEAHRLRALVGRPNVLVKVPATERRHPGRASPDRRGCEHQRHPDLRPRALRRR